MRVHACSVVSGTNGTIETKKDRSVVKILGTKRRNSEFRSGTSLKGSFTKIDQKKLSFPLKIPVKNDETGREAQSHPRLTARVCMQSSNHESYLPDGSRYIQEVSRTEWLCSGGEMPAAIRTYEKNGRSALCLHVRERTVVHWIFCKAAGGGRSASTIALARAAKAGCTTSPRSLDGEGAREPRA